MVVSQISDLAAVQSSPRRQYLVYRRTRTRSFRSYTLRLSPYYHARASPCRCSAVFRGSRLILVVRIAEYRYFHPSTHSRKTRLERYHSLNISRSRPPNPPRRSRTLDRRSTARKSNRRSHRSFSRSSRCRPRFERRHLRESFAFSCHNWCCTRQSSKETRGSDWKCRIVLLGSALCRRGVPEWEIQTFLGGGDR